MARSVPGILSNLSDEELVARLAHGQHEALGPLYTRFANLIFGVASQSLERSAAEEIVQDVFLALWRKADSFDPEQGSLRPWLLQMAHWRILNELRRQRRRPRPVPEPEAEQIHELADDEPDPSESAWIEERRAVVRDAIDTLPAAQREALALAFMDDLTHEQVANRLNLPLGTAKTRIRGGLITLRGRLAPLAASLLAIALLLLGAVELQRQRILDRDERALTLVTSSDVVPLRLTPVHATLPPAAHATLRGRPGSSLAIVTGTLLPPPANGQVYRVWLHYGDAWITLGTLEPDSSGSARLIAEDGALTQPPDVVEVTLESGTPGRGPTGQVVLSAAP